MTGSCTRELIRPETKDVLSNMTEDIRDKILVSLPLRDAARTSILSKKWRFYWSTISQLIFDLKFFQSVKSNQYASIVNELLLLHNGPILTFVLATPVKDDISPAHIDKWIIFLSRNGIKNLSLLFLCPDRDYYKLPTHFFSCAGLTHLKLFNCDFDPPSCKGFPNLIVLDLCCVLTKQVKFCTFVSSCPLLETLTLESCFIGAPSFGFCAPSLKKLSIDMLENRVKVENATMSNIIKVLDNLPRIEELCVGNNILKYLAAGCIPETLPTTLTYLKNLAISCIHMNNLAEVRCILCLIRSSPNLRTLEISDFDFRDYVMEPVVEVWEEGTEGCILSELRVVKFHGVRGGHHVRGWGNVMELMKFLLAHSPLLETMFVSYVSIDVDAALRMTKDLLRFPRASAKAEIVCCG